MLCMCIMNINIYIYTNVRIYTYIYIMNVCIHIYICEYVCLVHIRASSMRPALQGANKFFTLAMRPVQPLTWAKMVMAAVDTKESTFNF